MKVKVYSCFIILASKFAQISPFSLQSNYLTPRILLHDKNRLKFTSRRSYVFHQGLTYSTRGYRSKRSTPTTLTQIPQAQAEADNISADENTTQTTLTTSTDSNNISASSIEKDTKNVASYKALLTFVGTTVLIWLSEPLLSIVDTTVIGRSSAPDVVTQLAALGPATLVIDNLIYLTYFLGIATTNKIAKEYAENDHKAQMTTISNVLGLSLAMGLIITFLVFVFGEQMITKMVLDEKTILSMDKQTMVRNLSLISSAFEYAKIRSVVAPLAIMGIMAQSAALASLDTFTPFLAVIVASITNIIGDYVLCIKPFQWGIRGAAIATASASTAGSLTLLLKTRRRVKKLEKLQLKKEQAVVQVPVSDAKQKTDNELYIPLVSLPGKKEFNQLIRLAGPIFFVIMGKLICYSSMTIKVTPFGIIPLACHNIMMRIFFFCCTFGDSLSQGAQTFLPQVIYSGRNVQNSEKDKSNNVTSKKSDYKIMSSGKGKTLLSNIQNKLSSLRMKDKERSPVVTLLFRLSVVAALVSLTISNAATYVLGKKTSIFTSDASISSLISKHSKWIGFSIILHPFIMLNEGNIIAKRDLKFLVSSYLFNILALLVQLNFFCFEFVDVLKSLFFFQVTRFILFGSRVVQTTILKEEFDGDNVNGEKA